MPQVYIKERTSLTDSDLKTLSPLVGQIPPFAKLAPITAKDSVVISKEHDWKYRKYASKYDLMALKSQKNYEYQYK